MKYEFLTLFDKNHDSVHMFTQTKDTKAWSVRNGAAFILENNTLHYYDFGMIVYKLKDSAPVIYCSNMRNEVNIGVKYYFSGDVRDFMLCIREQVVDPDRIESCIIYMEKEGLSSLAVYTDKTFEECGLYILRYPQQYLKLRHVALTYISQMAEKDYQYLRAYDFINQIDSRYV